jgi:hypothetical protein
MRTEDRRLRIEDGRGGIEESPMYIDRNVVGENVHGPMSRAQSVRNAGRRARNVEDLRLKMRFHSKRECLMPKP